MALRKIKLLVAQGKRPTGPQEIFNKLTLRGSIGNIWQPQGEALKKWQGKRSDSDVVVQMNTGGGKTLVGLLIAQSIVNETKGRVLYVCPNNQLVEQIVDRAKEIGLMPAIRYKSIWRHREDFEAGNTFCVTNYAAVFNGRSIFRDDYVDALVFDDAHVAENVIRGQFTLKIPSDHAAFGKILHIFREHFANSSQAGRFEDISKGRFTSVLFVPMFIVWEHALQLRKTLIDVGVEADTKTKFAWEHLKEHLNHCAILVDGSGLEITPAVLPLSQLNYFQEGVRRIYLTATLPSQASFVRTFGVADPTIIQPSGKSGDAQRLFVFVPGEDDEEQRREAMVLVTHHKCCVIAPSDKKGKDWVPPANIYDTVSGQKEIDRFRKSQEPEMLGLIARYDGIDLPGDSCRVLILDRLPTGENLINRFIDESIRVETIRISNIATRVVQAIGRIFRSNTDHGVVLLVGSQLQSWVRTQKNRTYLPKLLQQQLLLAGELAKQIEDNEFTWEDLIEGLLKGDENWDEMYNEYIDQFETSISSFTAEWHIELILQEQEAYEKLWQGQFHQAADAYAVLATSAQKHDYRLVAWYRHWRGLALMCADDRQGAFHEFVVAANSRSELGRPSEKREHAFKLEKSVETGKQACNLAQWYRKRKDQIQDAIRQVESDLKYGPDTNKAEEACRILGSLLGLHAKRPDKAKGTGPDVTWEGEGDLSVLGLELKTNKKKDGEYFKRNISDCHDHAEWLSKNFGDKVKSIIVGPTLPVAKKANPSDVLQVVEIDSMRDLFTRAKYMFEAVEAGDKTYLEHSFQTWINYYGLNWPTCVESLDSRLAIDLKTDS
jgi:hypothetical protein